MRALDSSTKGENEFFQLRRAAEIAGGILYGDPVPNPLGRELITMCWWDVTRSSDSEWSVRLELGWLAGVELLLRTRSFERLKTRWSSVSNSYSIVQSNLPFSSNNITAKYEHREYSLLKGISSRNDGVPAIFHVPTLWHVYRPGWWRQEGLPILFPFVIRTHI